MTEEFKPDTAMMERIALHCTECGDCLEWNGSASKSKTGLRYPNMRINGETKLVRRVVYEAARGPIRAKHAIRTTCGNDICVNPDHLSMNTTAQISQIAAKAGKFSGLARSAKIAKYRRIHDAKLTLDQAMEIRLSSESGPEIAARYGINRSLAVRIKNGKAWRDYSNPFMSLGAR
jgi:hypothetical protein